MAMEGREDEDGGMEGMKDGIIDDGDNDGGDVGRNEGVKDGAGLNGRTDMAVSWLDFFRSLM